MVPPRFPVFALAGNSACGIAREPGLLLSSVPRRLTASIADMRFEGTLCQQCSIMYHARSEISWLAGLGGRAPFSIEYIAAILVIPKKGGRPVRICLE